VATCKSCGAPIVWAFVPRTGRRMPVDADPVDDGNVILTRPSTSMAEAHVVAKGAGTHVSHFATCPQAAEHRRR
jgi:hypothetical protein